MKFKAGASSASCCTALARAVMPAPIPTMMLRSSSAICPTASSSCTALLTSAPPFPQTAVIYSCHALSRRLLQRRAHAADVRHPRRGHRPVKARPALISTSRGSCSMKPTQSCASIFMKPPGAQAYLAGFHAAQALIFETSGRIYKSHSGVHGEFSRLVKDDPHVDDDLRAFLGRTYSLKAIADYETGPGSHVSAESARDAIATARRFIELIAGLLS